MITKRRDSKELIKGNCWPVPCPNPFTVTLELFKMFNICPIIASDRSACLPYKAGASTLSDGKRHALKRPSTLLEIQGNSFRYFGLEMTVASVDRPDEKDQVSLFASGFCWRLASHDNLLLCALWLRISSTFFQSKSQEALILLNISRKTRNRLPWRFLSNSLRLLDLLPQPNGGKNAHGKPYNPCCCCQPWNSICPIHHIVSKPHHSFIS